MRIIGGKFKGRTFYPPGKNWPTRPTTDFAKEGLFNILTNLLEFDTMVALDLFSGTGSHCFELLSRGCNEVTAVEKHSGCIRYIREMVAKLQSAEMVQVVQDDVFHYLKHSQTKFSYIFADPPFTAQNIHTIPDLIFERELLSAGGVLVLEHDNSKVFGKYPQFKFSRNYGKTIFSFFQ
jgi:16S rRNA (guanine(966)-N(2))-methyltransferase RsmD